MAGEFISTGGHEAYDARADEYSFKYIFEEEVGKLEEMGMTGEFLEKQAMENSLRVYEIRHAINVSYWQDEVERKVHTTALYEVHIDARDGKAKLRHGDSGDFLDDMLKNAERYYTETHQEHKINRQETEAILRAEKALVSGEATTVLYPVWHESGNVRYVTEMTIEDGIVKNHYIDIGKIAKRDLTADEAEKMFHILEEHGKERNMDESSGYPILLGKKDAIGFKEVAITAYDIFGKNVPLPAERNSFVSQEKNYPYVFAGDGKVDDTPSFFEKSEPIGILMMAEKIHERRQILSDYSYDEEQEQRQESNIRAYSDMEKNEEEDGKILHAYSSKIVFHESTSNNFFQKVFAQKPDQSDGKDSRIPFHNEEGKFVIFAKPWASIHQYFDAKDIYKKTIGKNTKHGFEKTKSMEAFLSFAYKKHKQFEKLRNQAEPVWKSYKSEKQEIIHEKRLSRQKREVKRKERGNVYVGLLQKQMGKNGSVFERVAKRKIKEVRKEKVCKKEQVRKEALHRKNDVIHPLMFLDVIQNKIKKEEKRIRQKKKNILREAQKIVSKQSDNSLSKVFTKESAGKTEPIRMLVLRYTEGITIFYVLTALLQEVGFSHKHIYRKHIGENKDVRDSYHGTWVLFSIIWYMTMIREQGMVSYIPKKKKKSKQRIVRQSGIVFMRNEYKYGLRLGSIVL